MNRSYAATKMNHQSSRSHALYRLSVQSMPKVDVGNDDDDLICPDMSGVVGAISTQAVLNFIDLAGSERASIHEASGGGNNNQMGQAVRQ